MSRMQLIKVLLMTIIVVIVCSLVNGCDKSNTTGKGVKIPMKTYYIGRFSIAVPVEMKLEERRSELAYVEIKEAVWPKDVIHEQEHIAEWNNFMAEVKKLKPPKGKNNVIIKMQDFPGIGQWAKGVYYYYDDFSDYDGRWALLVDSGPIGVWLRGNSVVDKENVNHYLENNIQTSGKSYTISMIRSSNHTQKDTGSISNMVQLTFRIDAQEKSYARFEGHPFNLVLDIKMEMDIGYYRETMGLIEGTKGMIDDASREPGISFSIVRLCKREVAGMKGEESILRASDRW